LIVHKNQKYWWLTPKVANDQTLIPNFKQIW
jgi:hypothetical protein